MILLRKGCRPQSSGLRPLFCAPQGLQNSAQGFNPGNRSPRATRPHKALPRSALVEKHPSAGLEVLKGHQIERPNKAEVGSDGPIVARPGYAL